MTKNTTLWDKVKDFFKQNPKPELPNAFPVKSEKPVLDELLEKPVLDELLEKPVLDELLEKLDEMGNVYVTGVLSESYYKTRVNYKGFRFENPWENMLKGHKFNLAEADYIIPGYKDKIENIFESNETRINNLKKRIDERVKKSPDYIAEIDGDLIFSIIPYKDKLEPWMSIESHSLGLLRHYTEEYSIFGIDTGNRNNPFLDIDVRMFRNPYWASDFDLKEVLKHVYNSFEKKLTGRLENEFKRIDYEGFNLYLVEIGMAWNVESYSYSLTNGLTKTVKQFPIDEKFQYEVIKPKKYSHVVNVGDITLPRKVFENIKLLYQYDFNVRQTGIVIDGSRHIKFEKENLVVIIEELPFNTTLEITKPDAWWNRDIAFK